MPIISTSGKLLLPLYIVLKKSTGTFGPRVQEILFRPVNIYIQASKSGKLTSKHFKTWFSEVYLPNTGPKSMLLLDSRTGHCPSQLEQCLDSTKQRSTIFNHSKEDNGPHSAFRCVWIPDLEKFMQTFSDYVILQQEDVNLHSRNEIIKLQSLTHNQLSSPRFKNLFQYAWYRSGYLDTHPGDFLNPVHFCFFKKKNISKCSICGMAAFIRCAWCGEYFCFKHFYEEYHYCTNYKPQFL
jgi:hypothetical protein